MKITALLAAGALALCAAPTTEARLGRHGRSLRWGGWNGAAAQAAAIAISGFSQGQLNGPSSGGYNPGYSNYNAPIVRPAWDEDDDDLGGQSFSVSGGVSGQSGGTNYNAQLGYKNEWDEDDDLGRWGGWNGAAAQAAAIAISGFSQGQLNGPSSGGYNPGYSNYNAPIVRPAWDEDDDDLGGQSFSVSGGVSGQSGGTNYNANFGYKNEWDEDDDDLGGKKKNRRSPRFCVNCPARSGNGFTAGDGLTPPPWRL